MSDADRAAVIRTLPLEPLTAATFVEFGAVVGREPLTLTSREFPFFTNLVTLERPDLPITYLNRHHDHQQLFLTLSGRPMIVIVAAPALSAAELRPERVRAFLTDGATAIIFHIDTWHIAPRFAGADPVQALNVQATNNRVHTERVELDAAFGGPLGLALPS